MITGRRYALEPPICRMILHASSTSGVAIASYSSSASATTFLCIIHLTISLRALPGRPVFRTPPTPVATIMIYYPPGGFMSRIFALTRMSFLPPSRYLRPHEDYAPLILVLTHKEVRNHNASANEFLLQKGKHSGSRTLGNTVACHVRCCKSLPEISSSDPRYAPRGCVLSHVFACSFTPN